MRRIVIAVLSTLAGSAVADNTSPNPASFVVYSYRGGPAAEDVLQNCESLREQIQAKWLAVADAEPWQPQCEIVLHPSRTSYAQAVGRGAAQTSGSSLILRDGDAITHRRIDLLVNPSGHFTALMHELTHVVLADRFRGKRAPLWADEGIATEADSATKKSLHHRDCLSALRNGTSLRLGYLLQMERFASPHQMPAFYGQSLSLVQFLLEQDKPSTFVAFLELAKERGYDHALRKIYAIEGIVELESQWRDYAVTGSKVERQTTSQSPAGG